MKRALLVSSVLVFSVLLSQLALANQNEVAEKNGPWERFSLSLGGFITVLDSDLSIGVEQLGAGITVDLESALGLDSSTMVWRANLRYRFTSSRRHSLALAYSDFRRDATKVVEKDVPIGDETISVGERVRTEFNFSLIRGEYSYSFFQDDRIDFSAGIGLYMMPIELQLQTSTERVVDEEFIAPLPTLYLEGIFAITPKLFLRAGFGVLYAKIGDFTGAIFDSNIALEYNLWEHVGFGLAFDRFQLDIEAKEEDYPLVDFIGSLEFRYTGILLYTKIYF